VQQPLTSRVVDLFLELCAIPSPPGEERAVADRVTTELDRLGLPWEEDDAAERLGSSTGNVVCRPGIVTSVVETAEQLLDQRDLNAHRLAAMLAEAQGASERFADEERIEVSWEKIWSIEPILFDETLVGFGEEAIRAAAGSTHRLPSGPLHDAAEVSRAGVPTVMLFVQSLRGLSHTKLEDTKKEHLELSVAALDRLATRTVDWVAGGGGRAS